MGVLVHESRCVSLVLVGLCLYPTWQARRKKSHLCSYYSYYRSLLCRLLLASSAPCSKSPHIQRFNLPFWLESSYIACHGSSPTTSRSYGSPLSKCYGHSSSNTANVPRGKLSSPLSLMHFGFP